MAFERLRQQREAEEKYRQAQEEQARKAELEAKLKREEEERRVFEEAEKVRKYHESRRQQALDFRSESQIVQKLEEFIRLARGWLSLAKDVQDDKTDPDSIVDRIYWDKEILRRKLLPQRQKGNYDITSEEFGYVEKCLLVGTFPNGLIVIRGQEKREPFKIGEFVLFKGKEEACTSIPESSWKNNPLIFEDPIVLAHSLPRTRRYTEKSESRTYIYPPSYGD